MCESSNFSISDKSIPAAKSAEGTQGDKSAKDLGFTVVCIWSYFGCGTKHEEATCKQRFDDCVSGQSKEITKVVHNLCYFFNFRKSATSFIGWLGQNNREYHSTSSKFY